MATDLSGVRLVQLTTAVDHRGKLTAAEGGSQVPFEIRRIFYVYGVQPKVERGGHAHPNTEQFLIAVAGQLTIDVASPHASQTFRLDDPGVGLYVPVKLWVRLYDFSPDAVCLAAASTHYAEEDVLREWDDFLRFHQDQRSSE